MLPTTVFELFWQAHEIFYIFICTSGWSILCAEKVGCTVRWIPGVKRIPLGEKKEIFAFLKELHRRTRYNYLVITQEPDQWIVEQDIGQTVFARNGSLFNRDRKSAGIRDY